MIARDLSFSRRRCAPVMAFRLLVLLLTGLCAGTAAGAGTWTPLTNPAPGSVGHLHLLSDGTVIAINPNRPCFRLTPDSAGHYANGTWTTLPDMQDARLYFASQLLKDGRLFVAGGEYGTGGRNAEIYEPQTNTWTRTPASGHRFSDANSEILGDGRVLVAYVEPPYKNTLIYDPVANTWASGATTTRSHNESSWVKLPDGSVVMIPIYSTASERYLPSANAWVSDGTVPVLVYDPYGYETGPGTLLPNGKAIFFGSPSVTAIYTPSGDASPGSWVAGAAIPDGQGCPDAACAALPDGKVLLVTSPVATTGTHFPSPTSFYEYDHVTDTFSRVNAPAGGLTEDGPTYKRNLLVLPDGTVLSSRFGTQLHVYTPGGAPLAAAKPTITTITPNADGSYHLVGTQLNGINEGACYGDDDQNFTNYPIVRLTVGNTVYYAKTYNWSSTGVATGTAPVTTEFTVPANVPAGTYSLSVIANGVASDPAVFTLGARLVATASGVSAITGSGASVSGAVTSVGGASVTERGVVYALTSVNPDPAIGAVGVTKLAIPGTTGPFNASATGLAPATRYSFKVYATSAAATTYSAPAGVFTTMPQPPTIVAPTVGDVTFSSAVLGATVTADNGAPIIQHGMAYSLTSVNSNPAIGGVGVAWVLGGDGNGNYTNLGLFGGEVDHLVSNSNYSYRAFATNAAGTSYTEPITFKTASSTLGPGGGFASLTNPGGLFDWVNQNGLTESMHVRITGDLTAETGAVALNAFSSGGSLNIYPVGAARTISGNFAGALIRLNGADNVVIDGSLGGVGADRSLSLANTNTSSPTVVALISLGAGQGATNNAIKNCNLSMGATIFPSYGIAVGGSSPGSAGADNDNVTIQNNSITGAPVGIQASGTAPVSAGGDDNLAIVGNTISYNANRATIGIQAGNARGSLVSQNVVSVETSHSSGAVGISLETGFVSSSVTRNTVAKAVSSNLGFTPARGLTVGTGTNSSDLTIANNFVSGVNAGNKPDITFSAVGIFIGAVGNGLPDFITTGGVRLYHNSVRMTGSMGVLDSDAATAAICFGDGVTGLDVRNNIFANTQTGTASTQKKYATYGGGLFAAYDYNDFFVTSEGIFGAGAFLGQAGGRDLAFLYEMQFGNASINAHSVSVDPHFASDTDLHVTKPSPFLPSPLAHLGTPLATVTGDHGGAVRSAIAPFIGAHELDAPAVIAQPTGVSTSPTSVSLGGTVLNAGGTALVERGVVFSRTSVNPNPVIGGAGVTKLTSPGTIGIFTVGVSGLITGEPYSFKAYATNGVGTSYTAESAVSPLPPPPTITLPTATNITTSSADLGGTATGLAILERGVVYSLTALNSDPLIDGTDVERVKESAGEGPFSLSAPNLARGATHSFRAYVTNAAGTVYTGPVSTFTTLTSLQAWRQQHFGTTSGSGNAADLADPDRDGLTNLTEFAFGLHPLEGNSPQQLPQARTLGANYVATFEQPPDVDGITYTAEWSSTLMAGSWTSIPDTGSGSAHAFSIPSAGHPRLFFHFIIASP